MKPTTPAEILEAQIHRDQVIEESKLSFYDCANHFFETNDILEIIGVLEEQKSYQSKTQTNIDRTAEALKSLWIRHTSHRADLNELRQKALVKISKPAYK